MFSPTSYTGAPVFQFLLQYAHCELLLSSSERAVLPAHLFEKIMLIATFLFSLLLSSYVDQNVLGLKFVINVLVQ